jgi:mutator protein MutT
VSVGAVVLEEGRVLMVKRGHPPLQGQWSLPGGVVEVGETLREAVAREVKEETGLDVEAGPVVEVLDRVQRADDGRVEYHYVIIDYRCRLRGGRLACASDAAAAEWVAATEVSAYGVTPAVKRVVEKALELLP